MQTIKCDCGAELPFHERDLSAAAGKPFTCPICGRTRKLPLANIFTPAAALLLLRGVWLHSLQTMASSVVALLGGIVLCYPYWSSTAALAALVACITILAARTTCSNHA